MRVIGKSRTRVVLGALGALVVVAASVVAIGHFAFRNEVAREVGELFEKDLGTSPGALSEAELAGLPEPVQRWLSYSQVVGKERPATVRLKMTGEFRTGEGQSWLPLEAEEYYTTDPPGFIWPATIEMNPLLWIKGRDRYVDGMGEIDMRLMSVVPVASSSGPGLDQGALLRFLNETMWFPAAAVSPYISWEEVDANSARATMNYAGVTGSAVFLFDEQGRMTNMVAERYHDASGSFQRWSTPIEEYGEFNGVRVPIAGEGVWHLDSGDFPYIRLRIIELEYNHPEMY